jgi:hypothetical protein
LRIIEVYPTGQSGGEHPGGTRIRGEPGTIEKATRFRGMETIVPFDKGQRWRARAEQLRALAAATHEPAVRDNLRAMAEAFDHYALKWEGTALVFRFAPRHAPPAAAWRSGDSRERIAS